ncbi:hypothetical protein CRUP_031379 [Coryphaenoides rupestris]|nr:hypothetical protein CRUP_031379 [Coryphaenoides rupestris]
MVLRSCAVEINNSSGCFALSEPRVFMKSGCCEVPLPPKINPRSEAKAVFNKSTGTATGAVGVLTVNLLNCKTNVSSGVLAVMFSVPYDRNLYSNWYGVGIFDGGTTCDYHLYEAMYSGTGNTFTRAKAGGCNLQTKSNMVEVSATMSAAGEAVVRVHLNDPAKH